MKQHFKTHISLVILLCIGLISQAQLNTDVYVQQRADSVQRILMRDSLQISESMADQVLSLRDSMMQLVKTIRRNNNMTIEQQDVKAALLRSETNNRIREILGDIKYKGYLAIIRNRLKQRNITDLPLAGEKGY